MRLDAYMAEKVLTRSRSLAASMIKNGQVAVNGQIIFKPSADIGDGDLVEIADGDVGKYVSRGGLKLEKALEIFDISAKGLVFCDIGASTGGFTDCLLKNGAEKVYSVDCGHGQLDEKIRRDSRVVSLEGFNAKELDTDVTGIVDGVTMDVSFISQTKLYPAVKRILKTGGIFVSLIKPQFEVGKNALGKGGIVRDPKAVSEAIKNITDCACLYGFALIGYIESPIKGGDGNVEYIAAFINWAHEPHYSK